MASILLDIPLIRDGKIKDFIAYLNKLRDEQKHSPLSIVRALLEAIEKEYVTPRTLNAFVPWCHDPKIIALCMNYPSSRHVRRQGIKHFGKALSKPTTWEAMWDAVDGTEGLVAHLARVSVAEVKAIARAIGNVRGKRIKKREEAVEGLLRALLPTHYPGEKVKSKDKRPLQEAYGQMVATCSSEFVAALLDKQDKSNPLYRTIRPLSVLKGHGEMIKERVVDALAEEGKRDADLHVYLKSFCFTLPTGPGPYKGVSGPMAFSMGVLRLRLNEGEKKKTYWPPGVSIATVYKTLLRKCLKNKLTGDKLRDVFTLGLKLLDASPNLKNEFQSSVIWNELTTRWGKAPAEYEELLTQAMRLSLGGSNLTLCQSTLNLSNKLKLSPARTWDLLRLFCMHVPKQKDVVVDLDTTTDLKPLEKQQWTTELFYLLEKEKSIRLLENLQTSFPKFEFLTGPPSITSILNHRNVSNRGVLLSTMLRRDDPKVQQKAKETVDEFRKKAAVSREQTDRAKAAVVALCHAISSGSLDIYGETITWLGRYVRDPLTLKEVFARSVVLTAEGIDLLSGIPNPLPEDMTLEEVASRVAKANAILMTFHEHMLLAKREPSYQEYDWDSVCALFGEVISKRALHAAAVQKRLRASEADIYAAIWNDTLAMLDVVDVKFLRNAIFPVECLLAALPPTTLTGIAESMLATGAERRKKADRQAGDDLLEALSYKVLIYIIKGDKPELARDLVLKTILDRPDASSWHRQFLSTRFMRALTAKQSQDILFAFATAIGEKLDEQSYVRVGETPLPPSAPPQSIVKVTTVKYLAQLLDNAPFISEDAATEVLLEIFKSSTHRDIRLATLNSLLSLLNTLCTGPEQKWRSNPMVEKIMSALETAVPVVGSINERRPPSETEWKEASETGKLPDVSDRSGYPGLPPLMELILRASSPNYASVYPGIQNLRAEFAKRFILPIYHLSQKEQRRWTTLFLAKHKASFKATDLPPVPVTPSMWTVLLDFIVYLPQSILDDYNQYITYQITIPSAAKTFETALKKDLEVVDTAEFKHYQSLFSIKPRAYANLGTSTLLSLISDEDLPPSTLSNGQGITLKKVQDMITSHASLILAHTPTAWDDFTKSLRHPHKSGEYHNTDANIRAETAIWKRTVRPILLSALSTLQVLKEQYKKAKARTLLPSTNVLKHYLLPYPSFPPPGELDAECKLLAAALEAQLKESLEVDGQASVLRWPRIASEANTVSSLLNTNEERLRVASYIGVLVPGNSQKALGLNYVKMAVAMRMLEEGKGGLAQANKKKNVDELMEGKELDVLKRKLRKVLEGWEGSESEDLREVVGEWKKAHSGIVVSLWRADVKEEK